jgi:hypothetical protein
MDFFFPLSIWWEDAKRKHLKRKCKSEKVEVEAKSEKAKRKLEGKLPPFSWYFFCCFLVFCLFYV